GFALAGGIFFRAGAPLDPASLPDVAGSPAADSPVQLVSADGERLPLDVAFLPDGGPFGDRNLLVALPIQGIPMRPATRYTVLVTRAVRDAQGRPLGRSPEMIALAGGKQPASLPDAAFAEYRDVLATMNADPIAALAVFTTDDPAAALPVVRDD